MTMLGFFPKKILCTSCSPFSFCHPLKETLVTTENDFPNQSVQQFVCACYIWPSAHPTFSNSQLTHIIMSMVKVVQESGWLQVRCASLRPFHRPSIHEK
jgi:hypothetical protein